MAFLPVIAAVASVAAGAVGAVGAMQQAKAAKASANYNAQVQEQNAKTLERNRMTAEGQAESEATAKAREHRRTLSTIRAAYGKSGLDMAGSALDVLEDSALEGAQDVANIRYASKVRSQGYEDEAIAQRNGAQLSKMQGKAAGTAGMIGAASSLIGGLSSGMTGLSKAGYSLTRS